MPSLWNRKTRGCGRTPDQALRIVVTALANFLRNTKAFRIVKYSARCCTVVTCVSLCGCRHTHSSHTGMPGRNSGGSIASRLARLTKV